MIWQSVGANNKNKTGRAEYVSVEGCRPITGEEARTLRQWGVEVELVAAPGTALNDQGL
jgi:hypothetical protein